MKVFVSHIHEEAPLAEMVKSQLELAFAGMVTVFLSEKISLGTNWLDAIKAALTDCDLVLVLFSPKSHSRPWINIEAGYGVMAGKRVIPICCMGLRKPDLSAIYNLQTSVELTNKKDAAKLLDDIAAETIAKVLLVDREQAADRWVTAAKTAESSLPIYIPEADAPILVWLMGSVTDLPSEFRDRAYRTADSLAASLIRNNFRVALGRSKLLNYTADRIAHDLIAKSDDEARELPQLLAKEAARPHVRAAINPVILLGSLRSGLGIRRMFLDCIGRLPDVAVMLGGSSRTVEEGRLANEAQIPLLPLKFTGGAAANTEATFLTALAADVAKLQASTRDSNIVGDEICKLIARQVQLMRATTPRVPEVCLDSCHDCNQ